MPELTRRFRLSVRLCQACMAAFLPVMAVAEQGLDVEYAERMPLVTESMLLDITRSDNGFVAVGERGHVIVSSDGNSWKQAEVVPTRSTLTTVVHAGKRLWAGGHDAVIITSGDGGKTWTLQYIDPDRQQAVMDLEFSDKENGVAFGSYGLAMWTTDGGQHWENAVIDSEREFHLNSAVRFGDGRWLIAGEAGFSYRSYDDGESWEAVELPYRGSMWGAIRTLGDCVLFYGLRGHVMESCDFGTSWRELETGTQSSISGAAFDDGLLVLAGNSGIVLKRDDNGPFTVHTHSSGVDFSAVLALGEGRFLLTGEEGVHEFPEPEAEGGRDD